MEILKVEGLSKHFVARNVFGGTGGIARAVNGVSFGIGENTVLALVGESGCGKSTVARLLLRLIEPTAGSVLFRGKDLFRLGRDGMKAFRKAVQIIFQDPYASLNPRRTVFDAVSEPLEIHKLVPPAQRRDAVVDILGRVGLGPEVLGRYPHEFSGGQRQRICIARALAVSPELIVADEPLSALDVSIQAQILNLLQELRERSGISFLFISHDLRIVRYFSDAVGVMYLGKIVEYARTEDLFGSPMHPYTEVLFSSAPRIAAFQGEAGSGSREAVPRTELGDIPSLFQIPGGCPFHPRCPKRFDLCTRVIPELQESQGRLVSCHLWNPSRSA